MSTAKTETETAPKNEVALRREAYNAAERRLREENLERFHALVQEEAANRGVEYKRRLTEEEKAQQTLRKLLAEFPSLSATVEPYSGQAADPVV